MLLHHGSVPPVVNHRYSCIAHSWLHKQTRTMYPDQYSPEAPEQPH